MLYGFVFTWFKLFFAPFHNMELLWIIIPIYFTWVITDIYQEKKGTSLGNAVTNGAIVLWVAIDWARYLIRTAQKPDFYFWSGITLSMIMLMYGALIIYLGIKTHGLTKHIGRIREISYVMIMFSPIIYGAVMLSWKVFLTILIGLPIFYFTFEYLFNLIPDPKTYHADKYHAAKIGNHQTHPNPKNITHHPQIPQHNPQNMYDNSNQNNRGTNRYDEFLR